MSTHHRSWFARLWLPVALLLGSGVVALVVLLGQPDGRTLPATAGRPGNGLALAGQTSAALPAGALGAQAAARTPTPTQTPVASRRPRLSSSSFRSTSSRSSSSGSGRSIGGGGRSRSGLGDAIGEILGAIGAAIAGAIAAVRKFFRNAVNRLNGLPDEDDDDPRSPRDRTRR